MAGRGARPRKKLKLAAAALIFEFGQDAETILAMTADRIFRLNDLAAGWEAHKARLRARK